MKNEIVLYEGLDGQCDLSDSTALINVALSNDYGIQRGEGDEFPNYYKEHENSWGAQIPYIALGVLLSKLVDYVWPKVVSAVQGWLTPTQSDADSENDNNTEDSDAGTGSDSENVVTVSIGGERDSMDLFVDAAYNVKVRRDFKTNTLITTIGRTIKYNGETIDFQEEINKESFIPSKTPYTLSVESNSDSSNLIGERGAEEWGLQDGYWHYS